MAGNMHNNSPKQQDIRVQLTSNEPIRDNTWSVYGYPNTLRLEESKGQTNNANEKNFSLVGTLAPGDYFITVRLEIEKNNSKYVLNLILRQLKQLKCNLEAKQVKNQKL